MGSEMFPALHWQREDARPSAQIPYPETQDWPSASSFHMVSPWGCSTHTACYKSPVKKQGTQERCLAHGQRDGRPDFHVSQYHILPGCLICSDAEFPLETVPGRYLNYVDQQITAVSQSRCLKLPPANFSQELSCLWEIAQTSPLPSTHTTRPESCSVPPPAPLCHPTVLVVISSQDR